MLEASKRGRPNARSPSCPLSPFVRASAYKNSFREDRPCGFFCFPMCLSDGFNSITALKGTPRGVGASAFVGCVT